MEIDFTQVPDAEFIEESGEYPVCIMDHDYVTSKSGTQGIEYKLETQDGRKLKFTFWLSEKAQWKLKGFITKTLGITDENRLRRMNPEDVRGMGFVAIVKMEEGSNGKMYANVVGYRPAASGQAAPVAPRPSAPAPSAPAQPAPSDSGENSNDDLPF